MILLITTVVHAENEGLEELDKATDLQLKAKSLPSVALDGDLVYESLIPMQEELIDEIRRRYKEKNQDE